MRLPESKLLSRSEASDLDKAYMAGIIDADGCIFIRRIYQTYKNVKTPYYSVAVTVVQVGIDGTDYIPPVLTRLVRMWGGSISGKAIDKRQDYIRRPVWRWQICSKEADRFLNDIQPYLMLKRDQADLAIDYRAKCIAVNRWSNLRDKQEKYFERMKELKRPTGASKG